MQREATAQPRKLAAILHADVAGYTALMQADEGATHDALRRSLDLAESHVRKHGGRIVGTAGDAFLAEFPSVGEALAAAGMFQKEMACDTPALPEGRRLVFRIGINLGEIIADGDEIYGDGVNVAARLQTLAPPGGIAVSDTVHAVAGRRAGLRFRDLGRHRVKNVSEPVRAWLVEDGTGAAAAMPRCRWIVPGLVLLALLAGLAALWTAMPLPSRLVAALWPFDAPAPVASHDARPTVAILPFGPSGAQDDRAWFTAGVTEDVIHHLGRFSGLLVLSWNAVAGYRENVPTLSELGRDLGVRYVVGGTVRRHGERLRISVELSDTGSGVLLWSARYEEPVGDVFEMQDRIARAIVGALAVQVTEAELARASGRPTGDLGAYELVLQGRALLRSPERDRNLDARDKFRRALELDHAYADAHVGLGSTYSADVLWGWTDAPAEAVDRVEEHARAAIAVDPDHAGARAILAEALWFRGRNRLALDEIRRALELNPNSAFAHGMHGVLLMLEGRPSDALPPLELALRLDPKLGTFFVADLAVSYYLLGRYEDAVAIVEEIAPRVMDDPVPFAVLAAALAQLGRLDAAREAAEKARRAYPFFDARVFAQNVAGPEDAERLVEGLNLAGLD